MFRITAGLLLCLTIVGCAYNSNSISEATYDSYLQDIYLGMSHAELEKLSNRLGEKVPLYNNCTERWEIIPICGDGYTSIMSFEIQKRHLFASRNHRQIYLTFDSILELVDVYK